MSDCSSEAMKPKDPQTYSSCCPYCGQPTPHADAIRSKQQSIDKAVTEAWREKESIKQRYQQLEQVAIEQSACLYEALMGASPNGESPDRLIDKAQELEVRLGKLRGEFDE